MPRCTETTNSRYTSDLSEIRKQRPGSQHLQALLALRHLSARFSRGFGNGNWDFMAPLPADARLHRSAQHTSFEFQSMLWQRHLVPLSLDPGFDHAPHHLS